MQCLTEKNLRNLKKREGFEFRRMCMNLNTPESLFPLTSGWETFCQACAVKVGTHEGTSRRDLFQRLVRCRGYTMGQVAGTSPLGVTRGDLLHIEIAKFRATSLKFRETWKRKKKRS